MSLIGPLLKDSAMLDAVTQNKDMISTAEERCGEAEVSHFFTSFTSLFLILIFFPSGGGESVISLCRELPIFLQCNSVLFLLSSVNHQTNTRGNMV